MTEAGATSVDLTGFPGFAVACGHRNLPLYTRAVEQGLVSVADVLTIRDILIRAGGQESLEPCGHCLLIALFAIVGRGSTCLPLDATRLSKEFAAFCAGEHESMAASAVAMIKSDIPTMFRGDGGPWPLVVSEDRLYFSRVFDSESSLRQRLASLVAAGDSELVREAGELAGIINMASIGAAGGRDLNALQKLALFLALRKRFLVVSGGPGTGKTAILGAIVRAFTLAGVPPSEMLLTAPTGRAARRMGELLDAGMPAVHTIHAALGYNPSRGTFRHTEFNPLPYRLVACDEVSMVDVGVMDSLLAAVRDDATVVMLGDRDQLPSVDVGAVLGDLVGSIQAPQYRSATLDAARAAGITVDGLPVGESAMADRLVLLRDSYRTTGDVLTRAGRVNRGDRRAFAGCSVSISDRTEDAFDWGAPGAACRVVDNLERFPGGLDRLLRGWIDWWYSGLSFVGRGRTGSFRDALAAFRGMLVHAEPDASDEAVISECLSLAARGRILCALRDGSRGASGVNLAIQQMVGSGSGLYPGCPVMVTRNSRPHNLYNGDTGMALATDCGLRAWFMSGKRPVSVPVDGDLELVPAHAVTIHKSQGSEYDNVMVILPDSDSRLLSRELIYTAMTRSRNNAWIVGRQPVIEAAIAKRIERYSGIDLGETAGAAGGRDGQQSDDESSKLA